MKLKWPWKGLLRSSYAPLVSFLVVSIIWSWTFWSYPSRFKFKRDSIGNSIFLILGKTGPAFAALTAWDICGRWPRWNQLFRFPEFPLLVLLVVVFMPVVAMASSILFFNAIVQHEDVEYSFYILCHSLWKVPLGALNPTVLIPTYLLELGFRGFAFVYLSYAVAAPKTPGNTLPQIRNPLLSVLFCGFWFWLWHCPLVRQKSLWPLCDGKFTLYFKIFSLFSVMLNVYVTAAFQLSGMSLPVAAYAHSLVEAMIRYVEQEMAQIADDVVLWGMTVGISTMGLVFAPLLARGAAGMRYPARRRCHPVGSESADSYKKSQSSLTELTPASSESQASPSSRGPSLRSPQNKTPTSKRYSPPGPIPQVAESSTVAVEHV